MYVLRDMMVGYDVAFDDDEGLGMDDGRGGGFGG